MQFPTTSETFVINHVVSLLDRGHDVRVFSYMPEAAPCLHRVVNERKLYEILRPLDETTNSSRPVRFLRRLSTLLVEGWREPGVTTRSLNPLIGGHTAYNLSLFACARAFEPYRNYFDIVHCHFGWSGIIGARLKRALAFHAKLIVTFHGSDVTAANAIGSTRQRRLLFDTADWFTANTGFIKNRAVAIGCPSERCSIWHMGVDPQTFTFHERKIADGEPIRILTVARLVETKGIEYVIRALPIMKHTARKIEYHVVGDGPLRDQLEKLAEELGVDKQVTFHGSCSAETVRTHLYRSHIFVLASVTGSNNASEGQGVVLIEAQASGLPVVATRMGGIPEAVLDEKSAYLVPERDPNALAAQLDYLVEHSQLRGEMGRAGRQFIERNFSLDRCTNVVLAIYDELLKSSPSTDRVRAISDFRI